MKVVIQTVQYASCTVEGKITGKIDQGYMILVGFGLNDSKKVVEKMAKKVANLRVFEDAEGKMNLSLKEVGGDILSISQFTLYGDCKKGNRPSFTSALKGAEEYYAYFNECLRAEGYKVEEGIFGAHMEIALCNDGPKTFIIEMEDA